MSGTETLPDILDCQNNQQASRQAGFDEVGLLQQAVRSGAEMTGSRLHDGLLALYGVELLTNPAIVTNYERIAAGLAGKTGQPVVVVKRWGRLVPGCYGFGQRPHYETAEELSYGQLTAEELSFDYQRVTCALPMAAYASTDYKTSQPRLYTGGVVLSLAPGAVQPPLRRSPVDLGRDLEDLQVNAAPGHIASLRSSDTPPPPQLWLYAGQPAIDSWLSGWHGRRYQAALDELAARLPAR